MKTCIVVPCKIADEYLYSVTFRFLDSIDKRTVHPDYEVFIYNNNSEHHLTERLTKEISYFNNRNKFKISTIDNYIFNLSQSYSIPQIYRLSQIYNWSLLDSDAELFVLCNNDMEIVNPEWLTNLIIWFNATPNLGMCIPFHDNIGDPFKVNPTHVLKDHGQAAFAIYAMTRKVIKEIGGFDERFNLYYHDYDVRESVKNKGYKVLWAYDSIVKHYGDRTTINHPKSGISDNTLDKWNLLKKKWNF